MPINDELIDTSEEPKSLVRVGPFAGGDAVAINSVTMPAGDYWVGDPCYVIDGEHWSDWLKDTGWTSPLMFAYLDMQAGYTYPALGISTAYGDGSYSDQNQFYYCVDAGMIGVVDDGYREFMMRYRGAKYDTEHLQQLSQLITFDAPFECYRRDEDIIIGHLTIKTGDSQWDWEL